MDEISRQNRSITTFSRLIGIFPVVFFIVHSLGLSGFATAYVFTGKIVWLIAAIVHAVLLSRCFFSVLFPQLLMSFRHIPSYLNPSFSNIFRNDSFER